MAAGGKVLRIQMDGQRVLFGGNNTVVCRTVFLQRMKVVNAGSLLVCLHRHGII
jgi:hypothetical protein